MERWTARGIQIRTGVLVADLTSLLKGRKMLGRINLLLPKNSDERGFFKAKSKKAKARDQDQFSEIHRITW